MPEFQVDKPEAFGLAAFWMLQSLMATLVDDGRLSIDDIESIASVALESIEGQDMLEVREQAAFILVSFLDFWREQAAKL